jgi:3-hydroxybutyryl-CoA dehydrogenase
MVNIWHQDKRNRANITICLSRIGGCFTNNIFAAMNSGVMTINSICVCGAGTMGSGIAQAAAQSGFAVILYELNTTVLEKAAQAIDQNLQRLVEKEKMTTAEKEKIVRRIRFTDDVQTCLADIFIEAIIEKPAIKIALFNQLAELNHSECIFASNTSSLSITKIAEQVQRPERVIGMHFFNPATIMKLVEVVNTDLTNEQTTQAVVELAKQMNKTPVICKDSPGFIVNRVARPFYIESLRLVEEGLADIAQIDRLLEATGFKMGPFKLMDLIGNDINYAVSCSVYEQLGNPERLKPSFIQEEKVKEGKLGKKSGEGYYKY